MYLTRYKGVLAGAALSFAMITGCGSKNEEGPQKPTTVEEDKRQLNQTRTNLFNCVKNIKDGQFMQSILNTVGLKDGDIANEQWLNDVTEALDLAIGDVEVGPDSRFDFAHYAGKYTWNPATKKFDKTASSDIVVTFPSDPASTKNNYEFTITGYKDDKYQVNAENVYLPTAAKATLTKDGTQLFRLEFAGSYAKGNFPIPQNITLKFSLAPHDYLVKVDKITNTQFNAIFEMQTGSDCVTAFNGKFTFANDDYNNLSLHDDLVSVEGGVKKGDLAIKGSWDAKAYFKLSSDKAVDVNPTFSVFAYNKDAAIGEFRFKDNASNGRDLMVFYKDKTSENAMVYSDPFISDLKGLLKPYFGTDVNDWFNKRAESNGSFSKKITKLKNKLSDWVNSK
ncbi:hypothetical protein CLV59_10244 [Chitinophaga dinghuensis]|uniref:Uncharacterized protein n=1 Tax=Chitinophaga dinghuensis TaxID=1539050 RepID=A0A327W7J0_9BACT|nr:hypothetical protein [Chitinophaga dinghuensis]RAJ85343.1 hypothetical protein CLV59_10244 [Chitinophaga dinghuensis]